MQIFNDRRSPNYTDAEIRVEFIVVHYTATDLPRTLEIFTDPKREVSAHIVIDRDGAVYELVQCLNGKAYKAWHAGVSKIELDGKVTEGLNGSAIGIELVNFNGNIFPYTDAQYRSLEECIKLLKKHYPNLCKATSILGHEQIAGFRGKCDPGRCFDWNRVFDGCYIGQEKPARLPVMSELIAQRLISICATLGVGVSKEGSEVVLPKDFPLQFFEALSSLCESIIVTN